jgi:undecaprenyl-diphosphatase
VTTLQAFLVALIQGLTEFLPVSSSAHLILLPQLLGWPDQGLTFDITTHLGSLMAVLIYFRRDLRQILVEGVPAALRPSGWRPGSVGFLATALALGTLPVAVAGFLAQDWVGSAGRSVLIIATTSIVFGLLLGWADATGARKRAFDDLDWRDVLIIGAFQALAIIPGTSRSGITMTAALLLGLKRPAAARFSFLLSIPIGLLVGVKDVWDLAHQGFRVADGALLALGFLVSAVSAYAVIKGLLTWLERQSLKPFVIYRVLLGAGLLIWVWTAVPG